MAVDVLYVISNGFPARTVLHTDLVPELKRLGCSVGILVANGGADSIREPASRLEVEVFEAPAISFASSTREQMMRRYLTENVRKNPALWANHLIMANNRSPRKRVMAHGYLLLSKLAAAFPPLRRAKEKEMRAQLVSPELEALLKRISPSLVASTYPASPMEAAALLAAKNHGMRTLGQLLSWDNITCKGRFTVVPDSFISWGPIMSEELAEYYGVGPDRVVECGVAHFDPHSAPVPKEQIAASMESVGLDPAKPYLLFAMSSPYFFPKEIDVVEWLAGKVAAGAFGPDIQLMVRPHPQNVTGSMADLSWLPRLDALKGPRVGIDYPKMGGQGLSWNMDESDLPHLAAIVAGCSISLNSGSTMAIDCLMRDRPVILTPFDADDKSIPWHASGRRVTEYIHLRKLIETGGLDVAASFAELETAIKAYLADPGRLAEKRIFARQRECGPSDGQAGKRIAAAVAKMAMEAKQK